MLKTSYLKLVILFLLLSVIPMAAQTKKEMEEDAYNALNDEDYATAYTLFDQLNAKYPKEFDYQLKLGISCLRNPERKERAIDIFSDMKKVYKTVESDYYLGKAYHLNYKFDEAIPLLETYISERSKSFKKEDKELVENAKLYLKNCENGKLLVDKKVIADIKNIEPPINTEEEQYVPVITTDESIMFFTYSGRFSVGGKLNANLEPDPVEGKYNEDVYIAYRRPDGKFSEPIGIDAINTKGNDAAIAISPDGQTLFTFYSDAKNSGDIAYSKLVGDEFTKPILLNKNINSEFWEGSCSISADGRFLYFASERPGGLGGRDIWVSEKIDGDWGPAKNMGPNINTVYDDDAPFIHPDGITLFLSSKGHSSIGGYDIMFSIKKDGEWAIPKSMGLPLNTTEDDRFYVINSKGDRGYFSSNRASSGGKGKNDIYYVEPGILGEKPVIALLKGTVYGNDQPLEAKIEIIRNIKKDQFTPEELEILSGNEISSDGKLIVGTYFSNSKTGKYLTTLNPGARYRIKVSADDYESVEEDVDIENLKEYMETTKDFYLVSTHTVAGTPTVAVVTPTTEVITPTVAVITPTSEITPTVAVTTSPCSGNTLPDFGPLKGKSLNDIQYYKQLLNMAGDYCAGDLIFKVQIGAYRKPENFKYPKLQVFGKAEVVNYPDGITRFTQKEFKTIKEAEVQRQKAIAKGQTDAWIVAFVDGKRYTLEDLIMLDFLGKAIN
ncbi:MAG: hypothetical protein Q8T03_03815 [Bacteroidota bacterium]|nr:hypothetical protein [Bacteroidota bacterium]